MFESASTDQPLPSAAKIRQPAVAGTFYPSDPEELFEAIHRCFTHPLGPGIFPRERSASSTERVECLIVPHAGYEYSGPIAAHSYEIAHNFFSQSDENVTVLILGPNHHGIGSGLAVSSATSWKTPMGSISVNEMMRKRLCDYCQLVDVDDLAHLREHSIEVQMPFLQAISQRKAVWNIVPISMMLQDIDTAMQLGGAIAKLVSESSGRFLIIGSSDLTHYENQKQATVKDLSLLDKVKEMDLNGFYNVLNRKSISSCGYGAIATVLYISKTLGKNTATLLKYATSGDITGDESSVVGYPSVRFI